MHVKVVNHAGSKQNGSSHDPGPRVYVVDSDAGSARFVADLVRTRNLPVQQFNSAEQFWGMLDAQLSGCAVVEVDLPGMSGIQLQERMAAARISLPVIVTAAEADAAVAVRAMKLGATDFLQKPCHPLELWEAIQAGLEKNRIHRHEETIRSKIRARLEKLTAQEQVVLQMVLAGKPNKSIAEVLDLSLRSIDFRRASIFRKTQARSVVELAQMLALVNHSLAPSGTVLCDVV